MTPITDLSSSRLKHITMKKLLILLFYCTLLSDCAMPQRKIPSIEHRFSTNEEPLSSIQIAAGLLEGIASLPYYLSTHIKTINQGLVDAQADITLNNTYESIYGKHLSEVFFHEEIGIVFSTMKQATQLFQRVLKQYGISNSAYYILTGIDESRDQYTLLTVIYRPIKIITVIDKQNGNTVRSFSSNDKRFYKPYQRDIRGNALDIIIDWAALSKESIQTQKAQAILITLAANSVLNDKKTPKYWNIEKLWLAGGARNIIKKRNEDIKKRMGI